jgi:hypothetical protein
MERKIWALKAGTRTQVYIGKGLRPHSWPGTPTALENRNQTSGSRASSSSAMLVAAGGGTSRPSLGGPNTFGTVWRQIGPPLAGRGADLCDLP